MEHLEIPLKKVQGFASGPEKYFNHRARPLYHQGRCPGCFQQTSNIITIVPSPVDAPEQPELVADTNPSKEGDPASGRAVTPNDYAKPAES